MPQDLTTLALAAQRYIAQVLRPPDYTLLRTELRNIARLLHDKRKLGEWMETVPEPEPLEIGAEVKGKKK